MEKMELGSDSVRGPGKLETVTIGRPHQQERKLYKLETVTTGIHTNRGELYKLETVSTGVHTNRRELCKPWLYCSLFSESTEL